MRINLRRSLGKTWGLRVNPVGTVSDIKPGTGAADSGLAVGDIIRSVNSVTYSTEFLDSVLKNPKVESVDLQIDRQAVDCFWAR